MKAKKKKKIKKFRCFQCYKIKPKTNARDNTFFPDEYGYPVEYFVCKMCVENTYGNKGA
jgi:hypothetical protein